MKLACLQKLWVFHLEFFKEEIGQPRHLCYFVSSDEHTVTLYAELKGETLYVEIHFFLGIDLGEL